MFIDIFMTWYLWYLWLSDLNKKISCTFNFSNFYQSLLPSLLTGIELLLGVTCSALVLSWFCKSYCCSLVSITQCLRGLSTNHLVKSRTIRSVFFVPFPNVSLQNKMIRLFRSQGEQSQHNLFQFNTECHFIFLLLTLTHLLLF